MSTEEYNRGYYGGHESSAEAQRGKADRWHDDRQHEHMLAGFAAAARRDLPTSDVRPPAVSHTSPATFRGTVWAFLAMGTLIGFAYSYAKLETRDLVSLFVWAVQGMVVGAMAGIAVYAAIALLRVIFVAVEFAFKLAIWVFLVSAGIYVLVSVLLKWFA